MQKILILGFTLCSGFSLAQSGVHVLQANGKCEIKDRVRCKDMEFTPTHEFERARLKDSHFDKTKFLGTDWAHYFDMKGGDFRGAHFDGATLNHVDMTGSKLEKADFTDVTVGGLKLNHVTGRLMKFTNSPMMKDVDFNHSKFQKADFSGVKGENWKANHHADFYDANFKKANLKNVNFEDADLQKADFQGATIDASSFVAADLRGASFKCAIFKNDVKFEDAQLEQVDLMGADLSGMRKENAILRLLEPHYCGTKISDGVYESTLSQECEIPDGDAPPVGFCP